MKKILIFAIGILFAFGMQAQNVTDEVALVQDIYGMGKKQLITDFMKLTDAESASFWKIYDEYEVTRKDIGMDRANNLFEYAKNYKGLTNDKATQMVNASLAFNSDFIKLQKKTFKKMAKAITPVRAAQFFQAEMYLENIIRGEIGEEIPFIGEVKKK